MINLDLLAGAGSDTLPRRSALFLERTARSISEVQPSLDTIPEVVIFLEVLGYNNRTAVEYGFGDLFDVARHLYPILDHYVDRSETMVRQQQSMYIPVPSLGSRVARGVGLVFPWVGSLAVLFFFGVSLWLVYGLPLSITTSLVVGLFFGLLVSEGPVQLFQRIFSFYYEQYNLSEVRRAMGRSAVLAIGLASVVVALIYEASLIFHIPFDLAFLSMVSAVTILLHRMSYVLLYSLKKFAQVVASYAVALATLVFVYNWTYDLIPLTVTRYLASLSSAVLVLTILPAYFAYRVLTVRSAESLGRKSGNPLNAMIVNKHTIMSNFDIQFWEGLPYYLFGMLFFALLFGDRVLSWFFNPDHLANGLSLPLVFNATYHLGADVALLVIFPAAVAQFVVMSPIAEQLSNLVTRKKVWEMNSVDSFLRYRYGLTVSVSAGIATIVAFTLIIFSHRIEALVGGSADSVLVLQVASIADVFMVIFMANCLFLIFMNKIKALAGITAGGLAILAEAGFILSRYGFQDIVYAYLIATAVCMAVSYQFVVWTLDRPGSLFFSRYI